MHLAVLNLQDLRSLDRLIEFLLHDLFLVVDLDAVEVHLILPLSLLDLHLQGHIPLVLVNLLVDLLL
jgi:hypothetical protein